MRCKIGHWRCSAKVCVRGVVFVRGEGVRVERAHVCISFVCRSRRRTLILRTQQRHRGQPTAITPPTRLNRVHRRRTRPVPRARLLGRAHRQPQRKRIVVRRLGRHLRPALDSLVIDIRLVPAGLALRVRRREEVLLTRRVRFRHLFLLRLVALRHDWPGELRLRRCRFGRWHALYNHLRVVSRRARDGKRVCRRHLRFLSTPVTEEGRTNTLQNASTLAKEDTLWRSEVGGKRCDGYHQLWRAGIPD